MIRYFYQIQNKAKFLLLSMFLSVINFVSNAQSPTHIPRQDPQPVNFFESTENIVFFIVIPVVIVILYMVWRRNLRKQREEEEKNQ